MYTPKIFYTLLLTFFSLTCFGQISSSRFTEIENKLNDLAKTVPGLNQKVDFTVTGISLQDFLRAIAESNNLNISISPEINLRVFNNFNNEEAKNILLFFCKEYNLDINFVGSIISVFPYREPSPEIIKITPKALDIQFDYSSNKLSLSLRKDTLYKVLEMITRLSDKNIITDPDVNDVMLINAYIQNMPFKNAIENIAYSNNLKLEISADSFYIIKNRVKEDLNVPSNNKPTHSGYNQSNSSSNNNNYYSNASNNNNSSTGGYSLGFVDSIGIKFINLNAEKMNIGTLIQIVSKASNKDYFLFSEPSGTVNLNLIKATYDQFLSYILTGTDFTYKAEKGIYLIGERKSEGLRETKVMKLEYRSFKDIEKAIPADLRKGVEIKEFPELNSFILSGSAPQIAEIEKITRSLDVVVPLIMIEVILVDVKRGKDLKTGIKTGLTDTTSGGSIFPGLDLVLSSATLNKILSPINLGRVTKNFYVGLSALETQNFADVQSMPKLATLNSHKANMTIGETRYYATKTQNVYGSINSNTLVTEQWNSVQANLSINITPVVSGDEHVTLDIQIEVADFLDNAPPNSPPPSTSRNFNSIIRVKDGEMILLGGMERNSKAESGSGFPVLSRIPIIKWFFSSKTRSKSKSLSYVFISPTIVY